MVFTIVTQVEHIKFQDKYFSYEPYIREMKIWEKYVTKLVIVAPLSVGNIDSIHDNYNHKNIEFIALKSFNFKTPSSILKSFYSIFYNFFKIINAIKYTNHLHLRCPGNIGFLGCIAQIFYPKKTKTVKYAGNWGLNAKQPVSYKIQKYILNATFLTKNCKVLVYGKWKNSSKNIVAFFTASYTELEKTNSESRTLIYPIKFIFVGTLASGKRPEYAIEIVNKLNKVGIQATLELYGDGILKQELIKNVENLNLKDLIYFKGNQSQDVLKIAYQQSHFLILPSKSEGWPKVVAEAMFWNCIPIVTNVSCIPTMLDNENRGIILSLKFDNDVEKIVELIKNQELYNLKANNAKNWSRKYTLDFFETQIKELLQQ